MPFVLSESDKRYNKRLVEDFLYELTELNNKYGVCIKSCGCCDSMWIEKMKPDTKVIEYLYCPEEDTPYDDRIADDIYPKETEDSDEPN